MNLYVQNILDRYKEPFYRDKNVKPDVHGRQINRSCGDEIEIKLELDEKTVKNYSFSGAGCAISQASADILGDLVIGKTLNEVSEMSHEELFSALGIEISPRRMKCALLGLEALREAILSRFAITN